MKNADQIKREIVSLTFLRETVAMVDNPFASIELVKIDAKIEALMWVIGNKPFNAEKYGA